MKKKIRFLPVVFIAAAMLTACGKDPQMIQFRDNVDAFCTKISEIDTSINGIDPESPDAVSRLLADLDDLNSVFRDFADLDFPGDFDYLEELADRSAEFMSDAVDGYRQAYADDSYNQPAADAARENYSKAYKCIQIMIIYFHGETPEDSDLEF